MAKQKRVYASFGPFTFAHPYITAPDTEGKYADNKYKVDAVEVDTFPGTIDAAKKELQKAAKELGVNLKDVGKDNLPIKKQTQKNDAGKKVETGKLLVRGKSQFPPAIVDRRGQPIEGDALAKLKVGAGTIGRIEGFFSDYELKGDPGISFTLTGVQIIKLVENRQSSSFGAWDDDYDGDDSDGSEDDLEIGSDADDADEDDGGELDI